MVKMKYYRFISQDELDYLHKYGRVGICISYSQTVLIFP